MIYIANTTGFEMKKKKQLRKQNPWETIRYKLGLSKRFLLSKAGFVLNVKVYLENNLFSISDLISASYDGIISYQRFFWVRK